MQKNLLLLIALLIPTFSAWTQVITTASGITVCTGATTVDIPVTVTDFDSVGSISLKFSYVNTEITAPSVIYMDPGITLWGTFVANTGTTGTIIISAYDPDVIAPITGLTLIDGSTLFTLRFTIGTITTPSALIFVENSQGTACEYGGVGPTYTPFIDTPMTTYYIPGGVTVYSSFTAGAIATPGETICYNGDPGEIGSVTPASGGNGSITYQWQSSTNVDFTSPTDISGSNSATYNPPANLTANTWYRRQAKDGLCNTSWNTSAGTWQVTVYNNFIAGAIATTGETICYNGDPAQIGSITPASGGNESITYQWQSSTDAVFTSPTNISSNTPAYNPPANLTVTTWYRRQAKDGVCNTSWNTSTGTWKVTVYNNFTAGTIAGTGENICYNGDPVEIGSITPASGGNNAITYQWQSSTNGGFSSPTDIPGSNSATYNPPANLTVNTWYRRQAKDGACNTSWNTSSGTWKVTVYNNFTAGAIATTGETICYNGDPAQIGSITPASGGNGSITYQWQSSTNVDFTSPIDISGSNSATYNPPANLTTNTWYRRQAKDGVCNTSWNTSTGVWKVTVYNNFTSGAIANTGETICYNGDPVEIGSIAPASGGNESITYQWQSSTDEVFTSPSNISSNMPTYDPPANLTVTTWYRRQAKDGVCNTSWNTSTGVWKVTVYNNFTAGAIAISGETICYDGDPAEIGSITAASGGNESITYRWQSSMDAVFTSPSNISSNTAAYDPPANMTITTWYRRQAIDGVCNTSWNTSTGVWKVTVYNNFTAGAIATTGETICYNGDPAEIGSVTAASGGNESITYQWQSSTDADFTSPADISGSNSATYNPPANLTTTTWYRRQAKDGACNTSWNISTGTWIVTVYNNFTPGAIATTGETICYNGDPAEIGSATAASGGDESITCQWQRSTDADFTSPIDISGNNSATYNPPANLTVTTWYRRQAKDGACNTSWNISTGTWKVTVNQLQTISGTFSYHCLAGDSVLTGQDIIVKLYKSSDGSHTTLLAADTTDGSGFYTFPNLCPDCDYDIIATSTHTTAGAVNTTDAAQVNYYGVHPYLIQKVRFHAGDVGTPGEISNLAINSTDAGRIQQHFVFGTDFDNTWTFWTVNDPITTVSTTESYPNVSLSVGSDLDADMYGLVTGDFNRSFKPTVTKSASSTMYLIYNGNRQVSSNQEFDLPIQMVNSNEVGAVSLILNFPSELVEVKDVLMNGAGGQLDWSAKGNELRIGWNSPVPLYLAASAELLILRLKTTAAFMIGNSIKLALASSPLNELADAQYNVISDALLSVATIDASAVGINENNVASKISMNNYPNPFSNYTMISYTLPFDGRVTLEISNIMGNRVTTLVNESEDAGDHMVKFETNSLPPGVYFAKLRLKSTYDELIRTIKLLNNK